MSRWLDPLIFLIAIAAIVLTGVHIVSDRLDTVERCARAERLVIERTEERRTLFYIGACP